MKVDGYKKKKQGKRMEMKEEERAGKSWKKKFRKDGAEGGGLKLVWVVFVI